MKRCTPAASRLYRTSPRPTRRPPRTTTTRRSRRRLHPRSPRPNPPTNSASRPAPPALKVPQRVQLVLGREPAFLELRRAQALFGGHAHAPSIQLVDLPVERSVTEFEDSDVHALHRTASCDTARRGHPSFGRDGRPSPSGNRASTEARVQVGADGEPETNAPARVTVRGGHATNPGRRAGRRAPPPGLRGAAGPSAGRANAHR